MIRYSVKGDDIDNFLEKIDVFYSKETLWSILLSNGEITIKTDNPRRRLFDLMDGNKDEMVVFETRYSLDNRPLHRAFPEMVYTHFALTKKMNSLQTFWNAIIKEMVVMFSLPLWSSKIFHGIVFLK